MKMFFLITAGFALLVTSPLKAQDGKPTKEQTVQFLQAYFEEGFSPCLENDKGNLITRRIDNPSISFDAKNCLMTFEYEFFLRLLNSNLNKHQKSRIKWVVDLSKVESLSLTNTLFGDCQFVYLNLNMAAGHKADTYSYEGFENTPAYPAEPEKKKSARIPIHAYTCNSCDDFETNKQVFQAFNHLRKLYGAPEPIKFD